MTKVSIRKMTSDCESLVCIRGDQALFNHSTKQMKAKYGIKENRALADFMPTILLKAKNFATEITIHNARAKEMRSEGEISSEHITNNRTIRETLISRDITPENLSPQEDVKKVERKLNSDTKKELKNMETVDRKDND